MVSMDIPTISSDAMGPTASMSCCPTIYLNDDQVEALGITTMPAPGSVLMLRVRAVVSRVMASAEEADETEAEGTGPDISLTLTCTDMEVTSGGKGNTAAALYGKAT